jgi:hypothetical protein
MATGSLLAASPVPNFPDNLYHSNLVPALPNGILIADTILRVLSRIDYLPENWSKTEILGKLLVLNVLS